MIKDVSHHCQASDVVLNDDLKNNLGYLKTVPMKSLGVSVFSFFVPCISTYNLQLVLTFCVMCFFLYMECTESFQEFSYLLKLLLCIIHQQSVEKIHMVLVLNSIFSLISLCLFYPNLTKAV